ncbi:MAG: hypothetical protein WA324_03950 [Bryobacteraceae bacterium]
MLPSRVGKSKELGWCLPPGGREREDPASFEKASVAQFAQQRNGLQISGGKVLKSGTRHVVNRSTTGRMEPHKARPPLGAKLVNPTTASSR